VRRPEGKKVRCDAVRLRAFSTTLGFDASACLPGEGMAGFFILA
jgi:hypothetical protein